MTDQPLQNNETFIGQCTSCGLKLKIPAQYLGQKVKCSSCGTAFEAQPAKEPAQEPERAPEPTPSPKPQQEKKAERRKSSRQMVEIDESITPDSLMGDFKGRKLVIAILLAIVLHAVLIHGTSFNYLKTEVFGTDTSEMSKEEKVQIAIGEATAELSKIADRHGLSVEDITSKFSAGGSRSDKLNQSTGTGSDTTPESSPNGTAETPTPKTTETSDNPDDGQSDMEKEMRKPVKGPEAPPLNIDDDMGL